MIPRVGQQAYEWQDQCALAHLLETSAAPGWAWTHLPMGELRNPAVARKLKNMGTHAGWPDFIFVHARGRVFWLELKRGGGPHGKAGTPSKAQHAIAVHLIGAGHGYLLTSSLDDAVATLKDIGVLPPGVHLQ